MYALAAISIWLVPFLSGGASAQEADWDTYVLNLDGKPVTYLVDLSLAERAPMRDRRFAILVRTRLLSQDANGMPSKAESDSLNRVEDRVEGALSSSLDAVYAGRYTQRGLRQFHFFAGDTTGYREALEGVFAGQTGRTWMARAVEDTGWSHYFDELYPPAVELERIRNRRLVDLLEKKGDALTAPRRVDHFFRFRTKSARESFLRSLSSKGFGIAASPEADAEPGLPYLLQVYRNDAPGYPMIDRVVIPLWEEARRSNGRYEGWETYLVKDGRPPL